MFANAAALYVSLGFKVFPLAEGSKLPAIKGGHGFKDASDDSEQIDKWQRQFPKANIAISTGAVSGIVVIDVDPRNGGRDTLAKLAGEGKIIPHCPQAKTGNNGWHFYFLLPSGLKASKDRLGKGIDIKSCGGYVVSPPSRIAKSDQGPGGEYAWIHSPENTPLGPFPRWALETLRPITSKITPRFEPVQSADYAEKSLEGMAKRLASADQGNRNNILNWAAFKAGGLVRQGKLAASTVEGRLMQAALAVGLTLAETRATIASGIQGASSKE